MGSVLLLCGPLHLAQAEKWVKDQWKELYFQPYFLKYLHRNVFNCQEVLSLVIIIISCLDSGTNAPSLSWFYFFFFHFNYPSAYMLVLCIFIIIHLKAFLWNINYEDIKVNRIISFHAYIYKPKNSKKEWTRFLKHWELYLVGFSLSSLLSYFAKGTI